MKRNTSIYSSERLGLEMVLMLLICAVLLNVHQVMAASLVQDIQPPPNDSELQSAGHGDLIIPTEVTPTPSASSIDLIPNDWAIASATPDSETPIDRTSESPSIVQSQLPQTATNTWQLLGFSGVGVTTIAISPNYVNDHTMLLTTSSGNYKSTNSAATWTSINTGGVIIGGLRFSPDYVNDNTVFGMDGGNVYRSTNGGTIWSVISQVSGTISWLAVSPNYRNDHILYIGTLIPAKVYRSSSGGMNWVEVMSNSNYNVRALAISPNYAYDHTLFVGLGKDLDWNNGGILRSTNEGSTWTAVNTGLTRQEMYTIAISPNYANDRTLFTTAWGGGIYRSTDGGNNWSLLNNGQPNTRPSGVYVSPYYATDRTVFYIAWGENSDGGFYISRDSGNIWTANNTNLTTRFLHHLAVSPNYPQDPTIFVGGERGNGGGLFALSYTVNPTYAIRGQVTMNGVGLAGVTVSGVGKTAITNGSGNYTLSGLTAGIATITPFKLGYVFTPASRLVTISNSDVNGITFVATGFNLQFNGNMNGLLGAQGTWNVNTSALYSNTLATVSGPVPGPHYQASIYYNANFPTLDYRVQVMRSGCETCATKLFVRGDGIPAFAGWKNGYQFNIKRSGYYYVGKTINGTLYTLRNWTYSATIKKASNWNLLRVVARGSSLKFYINNNLVWSGIDSSRSTGKVGAGLYSNGTGGLNRLYIDYATLTTNVTSLMSVDAGIAQPSPMSPVRIDPLGGNN